MVLSTSVGSTGSLFAKSPVSSPAGTGTGAAKALKAMERVSRAMRVFLNMMKEVLWI